MSKSNVVALFDAADRPGSLLGLVRNGFSRLFTQAATPAAASPDGKLPKFGPYARQIFYFSGGRVRHSASAGIDDLREPRSLATPHIANALELRCNALGLAVYVGTEMQFDLSTLSGGGSAKVRVSVFDFENLLPTMVTKVSTADELLACLQGTLMATFNRLSREYNLAGFSKDWLVLASANTQLIPDIPIISDSL